MSIECRTLEAIYFGATGEPEVITVPIQQISMPTGAAVDLPILTSLFPTPAPTVMLAITFQRARETYTVHFPDFPREAGRRLRSQSGRRSYVLVCRSDGLLTGYSDCDAGDFDLATRTADFAITYFRGNLELVRDWDDLHVRVCEYLRK
ncbi:hypothetical protein OH76DRAFT_1487825 [Lentinus brumalis]|uniref:Uncharacterized protein n=1 Tax=Lentinus brumalis TaxID=2498619 RepID=A0A371CT46_9APHY|nr:hypothetical protein OH76DRAFT_1487825 [Polyporus brumalis]